jgi:hypothetical protein
MKKLLGILVLGLLLFSNTYAETIFDIKSKNKNRIVIEAFEPTNNTQLINNKINFQEIKDIALKHCETNDIDWDPTFNRGSTFNGVYQSNRLKSVTYDFKCNSSENQIVNTNNDNSLPTSKKICLELGFTSGTEKFGDCVLKIMSMNNSENEPTKEVVSTANTTQDKQYNSKPTFPRVEKNKFYYKQLNRYSKMPESELCISYINAYGWHKREIKQAIKYEVLETRGINCDRYMDVAYYDKQKRDGEMTDALQDVFNSGVGLALGVDNSDDKNTKRTRRNCIVQKVGKNMYQQTCR